MRDRLTVTVSGTPYPAHRGQRLLDALRAAGLSPDAPCGGAGRCGKCRVLVDGVWCLACQTVLDHDCTVALPDAAPRICRAAPPPPVCADGTQKYALAIDIGTTTLAAFLLDGVSGRTLAAASTRNPQTAYGADVISRIDYTLSHGAQPLRTCILSALDTLTRALCADAGIAPRSVTRAALAGNTAMHHLLLGIDPAPLVRPPYMPAVREAIFCPAAGLLPIAPDAEVRILPNIAGFVGADTAAGMLAADFDHRDQLTLLVDIGTNGELVLGDRHRRIACSTAAGPAFEGANIHCGMRGVSGAIDHVRVQNGALSCSVIGGDTATGLCGSGLLDAIACALMLGLIDETGRMNPGAGAAEQWTQVGALPALRLQDRVLLTQKDVREVQLAKAALRAGIELLAQQYGAPLDRIDSVLLAGAFGTYLDPDAACRIGLLPPRLRGKIRAIGNAAGCGVRQAAVNARAMTRGTQLAQQTEFLELATCPAFQDLYVDCMLFEEEAWP